MSKTKVIVSLSGGMDSATLLAVYLDDPTCEVVDTVSFHYGSKHGQWEGEAARRVAFHYGLEHHRIDLADCFGMTSALMRGGPQLPEGHYAAENMRQTVVPGRNLIFISCLASRAEAAGADTIAIGAHAGDHYIYPDCRPAFLRATQTAVHLSSGGRVSLAYPFMSMDKHAILMSGLARKVPYHLTRTCYTDRRVACGKCGSCTERREAFQLAGVEDPIEYEYRGPLPPKPAA